MMTNKMTLSTAEAARILREHGFGCHPAAVAQGIASGIYGFGSLINTGKSGRRTFLIYRTDLMAWINEHTYRQEAAPHGTSL